MCKTNIMEKNREYIDMTTQENLTGKKLGNDLAILSKQEIWILSVTWFPILLPKSHAKSPLWQELASFIIV